MPRILTVRACVREPRETLRILKKTKNNFKDLHARGTCPGVVYGFHFFDWRCVLIFRPVPMTRHVPVYVVTVSTGHAAPL